MPFPPQSSSANKARSEIAREVLKVHQDSYGTGADCVEVFIHESLVVVLLDQIELTNAERVMVTQGRPDLVLGMRAAFEQEIRATFEAIVERATGRLVTGFVSNTSLEPLFSVEIFRLART